MFERKHQPLARKAIYYRRIMMHSLQVSVILIIMLVIGTAGYHCATDPQTGWLDAFHNASMILSGMGPVVTVGFTSGGKIFSSIYALFSGIIFITSISYLLAPAVHRFFHRFHLEEKQS
jgi:hypothetical protein